MKNNKDYQILDLFTGCGGLSYGLKSSSSNFKVIGVIDNDEKAITCFKHNFPEVNCNLIVNADIIDFKPRDFNRLFKNVNYPKPIIIVGGPPCPGFSTIGRSKIISLIKNGQWKHLSDTRHSFVDDPRNKLFFEFVKYVKYFKPALFILENVSGMSSYKFKNGDLVLDVIRNEFQRLGYTVKYSLLNSADYGVPQVRHRYFFVGTRTSITKFDFNFPQATHTQRLKRNSMKKVANNSGEENLLPYVTSIQALLDLPDPNNKDSLKNYKFSKDKIEEAFQRKYSFDELGKQKTYPEMLKYIDWVRNKGFNMEISCHTSRLVNEMDKKIFPMLKSERDFSFNYKDLPENFKRYGKSGFQDKMRRIPWWKPSWTIVAHLQKDGYMFIHPDTEMNRSITVREAARLQSFPDSFDFSAKGQIAMTHQFRLVGNAVPPLVARAMGAEIIKWLKKNSL